MLFICIFTTESQRRLRVASSPIGNRDGEGGGGCSEAWSGEAEKRSYYLVRQSRGRTRGIGGGEGVGIQAAHLCSHPQGPCAVWVRAGRGPLRGDRLRGGGEAPHSVT